MSEPISIGRKHPAARCEDCTLNGKENGYAPGSGPEQADIVLIGEAPGFVEAQQGVPFTGPSGKLLDLVLANYKIDREACYVDNVVACRPPDNRTPSKLEVACCQSRLWEETTKRRPRTIIPMGNTAAQSIMDTSTGITQLRGGPPKSCERFPGVDIVPTVHPAYCLRNQDAFPNFVTDIGKVVSDVRLSWNEPTFRVFDTGPSAVAALRELQGRYTRLVVDIEAGLEKDTQFDHPDHYQLLCIGICYAAGKAIVIGESALKDIGVRDMLASILASPNTELVAHNGKFDLAGLKSIGDGRLFFDTMLASYVVDERAGVHGLKYLATELLGAPDYASDIKRYVGKGDSYAVIPRDILYRYNAYDVVCTWALMEYYEQLFTPEQRKLHDFLVEASNALMAAEMNGITIDLEYLDHLTEHYLEGLEGLEKELLPWVLNPRSPKQVKEALLLLGWNVSTTNKDMLKELQTRCSPGQPTWHFLELMLTHRREQKLYGTYVKGIRKRLYQGRVHPTFLLHGTTTGRLACRNPNLQNVPRESSIRRLFVPADGNVYVQADYATIELRCQTVEAQDDFLRNIFIEGRDIHNEFSLLLYGPGFSKDQRVRTKAFVYGISYGREAYSIAQEYKIPLNEATRMMQLFTDSIPQTMAFRAEIKRKVLQEQDDLVTHFGRHRRFWLITEENRKDVVKEALAFIPQSTASDINLHAFIRLSRLGIDCRLPVHDSILAECRAEDAHEVALTMQKVMEETAYEVYSDWVPFPVDIEVGKSWGELGSNKLWVMEEDILDEPNNHER